MSAMASPYDVDAAVGTHVLSRPEDLFRSHSGQDEHDPKLVLQARVDRRSPDDPGVRGDSTLDDLGDLLRLGHAHVVSARDVHEGSGRRADVHVDQGRVDRLFDRLLRAVVAIRLAEADHRDPAALHDRLDVIEVEVHEARLRDDLRDPLDGAHQHIVRDLERRIQGETRDELKEFVIRDHDHRVRKVPELLEAVLRVLRADRSLRPKRERADRDRQGARLFRELREDRGAARPRAASEAARDEHHVRTLDDGPQFVRGLAGRLLADLGECAGSEAARDAASQEELVGGPDDEQMLGVRVRGEQLRPDDAGFDEAVDRVAAAAPDPDNLDIRPEAREDPLEFGVFRVDACPLRGGLREPRLNARATYDFPDNGIHFSASGCPRKRMKQPRHSRKGGGLINVSGFAPAARPPVEWPRRGVQRITSTPTRAFSSDGSRRPTICFDLTPVATGITRSVCSRDASTVAPQMIRAVGETFDWTTSATRSASQIVMSFPPVTLISTPWAVETSTSRSGELMASSIASTARLSPTAWLSPRPIIATPPPFMIVFTSLKSRFTRPGFVMISVSPLMDRMRTSSANLNARFSDCRGTRSSNLSFGIVMTVSAASRSRSSPHSALSIRSLPSPRNGKVTTAMVRAPISLARRATYPQLPVPVPPPRPHVTKTMSAPWTMARSSSSASRAASSPICGSAPAPRPFVMRRPRRTFLGEAICSKCCASVLHANSSAPTIPSL